MKHCLIFITVFLTSQLLLGQTNNSSEKIKEIDNLIQKLITSKSTSGFAFGIQLGDADPITKEYGFADQSNGIKIVPTDQFRIASITKPFTATAILKLVESGKLSLTDNIARFFPDYPNGANISIYHLLSHTSGIPNWWEGGMPADVPKEFPMCEKPHQYLQAMKNNALFQPGEFYKYSNSGYVLLGEIIETISGLPYNNFLEENIFIPAGMTSTEMEYIEKPSRRWVKGYAVDTSKNIPFVDPEVYDMPFSAGGLRSNALDLLKFIKALNSGKIISMESVKRMTSYALLNGGEPVYERPYRAPNGKPNKPHKEFAKSGYGLGFNIMELYGTPVYYHSGGIAGFNSYLIRIPKNNITMVLLANTEDGIIPELKGILKVATEIDDQKLRSAAEDR